MKSSDNPEKKLNPVYSDEMLTLGEVLKSPWRLVWVNFLVSVARGAGFALGITFLGGVVVSILIYAISQMVNLPLVGEWIAQFVATVQAHMDKIAAARRH